MLEASLGYRGKQVIVSGCHSGIGYATARLLTALGASVHGLDWQPSDAPLANFTRIDLRDPAQIDRAVSGIAEPVDALFNCAGLAPMHPALDVMKVNFIGMRHLSGRMIEQMPSGGAIVTVGSNGGAGWRQRLPEILEFIGTAGFDEAVDWCKLREAPRSNAYNFSKEAIAVWTMQHSAQTIARGIRLNATSPGAVQTPMLEAIEQVTASAAIDSVAKPIGRRSSAEEQAWALAMLNSPHASYINGVDLPVDGGFIAARNIAAA